MGLSLTAVFMLLAVGGSLASPRDNDPVCPVTEVQVDQPPDDPRADPFPRGHWYINEDRTLWAGWDAAQLQVGSNKVLWIRPQGRDLMVEARRLDQADGSFKADIPCCYLSGFQASALSFSKAGCWAITATAGNNRLQFVTEVR